MTTGFPQGMMVRSAMRSQIVALALPLCKRALRNDTETPDLGHVRSVLTRMSVNPGGTSEQQVREAWSPDQALRKKELVGVFSLGQTPFCPGRISRLVLLPTSGW